MLKILKAVWLHLCRLDVDTVKADICKGVHRYRLKRDKPGFYIPQQLNIRNNELEWVSLNLGGYWRNQADWDDSWSMPYNYARIAVARARDICSAM